MLRVKEAHINSNWTLSIKTKTYLMLQFRNNLMTDIEFPKVLSPLVEVGQYKPQHVSYNAQQNQCNGFPCIELH